MGRPNLDFRDPFSTTHTAINPQLGPTGWSVTGSPAPPSWRPDMGSRTPWSPTTRFQIDEHIHSEGSTELGVIAGCVLDARGIAEDGGPGCARCLEYEAADTAMAELEKRAARFTGAELTWHVRGQGD